MGRTTELRVTAVFLLGAAAIAWVVTVDRMQGMDAGPGTDLGSFGWFAGVWAVMMAAMKSRPDSEPRRPILMVSPRMSTLLGSARMQ